MKNTFIYQFIKSDCGRDKYQKLNMDKSFYGRIRILWFIIFASIRDINIKN